MDSITLANINVVVDARIELARAYMNLTHELDPMNAIVVPTFAQLNAIAQVTQSKVSDSSYAGIGMAFVTYRNAQFTASTGEVD